MKMKRYTYTLTDKDGNILARGTKKQVMAIASARYVYQLIFTDILTREGV